jgi:nucleotide-binding universal stress UspA family protein
MTAGPFCRVLVGWDGSPDAAEALGTGAAIAALAAHATGHVVALSVVSRRPHGEAGDDDAGQPGIRSGAEEIFARLRRDDRPAGSIRMSAQVVADDESRAGSIICSYAAEHGFDLLVLGRHGQGGRTRARLGRVAETAARSSPVPLLLLSAP